MKYRVVITPSKDQFNSLKNMLMQVVDFFSPGIPLVCGTSLNQLWFSLTPNPATEFLSCQLFTPSFDSLAGRLMLSYSSFQKGEEKKKENLRRQ